MSTPSIHYLCFSPKSVSWPYDILKLNSPSGTQGTIMATKIFLIFISIDFSFKIHQFVSIRQAWIKFGYYLTFTFTFWALQPENFLMQIARFNWLSSPRSRRFVIAFTGSQIFQGQIVYVSKLLMAILPQCKICVFFKFYRCSKWLRESNQYGLFSNKVFWFQRDSGFAILWTKWRPKTRLQQKTSGTVYILGQ